MSHLREFHLFALLAGGLLQELVAQSSRGQLQVHSQRRPLELLRVLGVLWVLRAQALRAL